jgi:hypothetical protein
MADSALPPWLSLPFSPLIQVSGYLNLLANTIDNFTHGLAVAASFLVSKKVRDGTSGISGGNDIDVYRSDQSPKQSLLLAFINSTFVKPSLYSSPGCCLSL